MSKIKKRFRIVGLAALSGLLICFAVNMVSAQDESGKAAAPGADKIETAVAAKNKPDEEKTISFDFPDTDIRVAIETISIKVGVNIVAGPEVKGKISMKLNNLPWQKALDILLKTYGYGYVMDEGIIRVMSIENLKKEEMMQKVVTVKYGSASDIAKGIAKLVSKDGTVEPNETARSIIIKDFPTNLSSIEKTIEKLDLLSKEEMARKEGGKVKEEVVKEVPPEKREITLDFKETPIREAMAQISALSGVFISVGEEVTAKVTLSTAGKQVPWQHALDTILQTAELAYVPVDKLIADLKPGDFITIRTKGKIIEINEQNRLISENVQLVYEVFELKYVDAEDVQKLLMPEEKKEISETAGAQTTPGITGETKTATASTTYGVTRSLLSPRGRIAILEMSGQTGWIFNSDYKTGAMSSSERVLKKPSKSRKLLICDIPSNMNNIRNVIKMIDVMPYQIAIETKVIEVSRDVLRDIGFEWGTGSTGADSSTVVTTQLEKRRFTDQPAINDLMGGGQNLGGYADTDMVPATFTPDSTHLTTANSGLKLKFQKLLGTQFEVLVRALEENYGANVLSAPKIMCFSNQEASILIGQQYPIVETTYVVSSGSTIATPTLKYYQNIGIRLSVVPQVSDKKYINMILHPAVTSSTSNLEIKNTGGYVAASYPIIQTREADTQVLMKNGETIVIGGLLKDEKKETRIGVPFFSDLPFIGPVFRRTTTDTKKMDLLIFVTAHIILKKDTDDVRPLSYLISKDKAEEFLKPKMESAKQ